MGAWSRTTTESTEQHMRHFPKPSNAPSGATWLRHSLRGRPTTRLVFGTLLAGASLLPALGTQPASAAGYDPTADPYSMAAVTSQTGATTWWNAGFTGRGVDVAVIDTGVSPVPGLDAPGKIINGPDLSLESQAPNLTRLDTNGHGTFMAGLIAGKDATLTAPYANAPATSYRGMAPDARIVSVKVGTADGGVDVSQVIAAINWVVQNKNSNGMNIRVLNLAYGTNSTQDPAIDPLSYAVERAWNSGIVVVVAAGNPGYTGSNASLSLTNPASNPKVIGVGGYDTMGTASGSDDRIGTYSVSSGGNKKPNFVAVGSHTQGLRVPNGYLDVKYPEGRINDRYFRGSGTSQATAITAGAAALILQKFPSATPEDVKKLLAYTAVTIPSGDPQAQGAGAINLTLAATKTPADYAAVNQTYPTATGTGSLEAARGTDHLARDGVVLSGEKDIFNKPFNSAAMAAASAAGTSWSGGTWNGSTWTGSSWSGSSWSGSSWSGSSWSGSSWSGSSWSGSSWSGSSWSGSSWSGSSWSGSSWSGSSWSGGSWN